MKKAEVTLPDIALIAGTRAMLGAGVALLLSDRLSEEQRKAVGWALTLVGALKGDRNDPTCSSLQVSCLGI